MKRPITRIVMLNLILVLTVFFLGASATGILVRILTVFGEEKIDCARELAIFNWSLDRGELDRIYTKTRNLYIELADEYTDQELCLNEWTDPTRKQAYEARIASIMDKNYKRIHKQLQRLCMIKQSLDIAFVFYDKTRERLVFVMNGYYHDDSRNVRTPCMWLSKDANTFINPEKIEEICNSTYQMDVRRDSVLGWTAMNYVMLRNHAGKRIGYACFSLSNNELEIEILIFLILQIPLAIVLFSIMGFFLSRSLQVSLIGPIIRIAGATEAFVGLDGEALMNGRRVFGKLDTGKKTLDEIAVLVKGMQTMEESVAGSLSEIHAMTQERERIEAELSFAAQIQRAMLPPLEESFTNGDGFSLYAKMRPAREVGGDFYDFFMIDPDHLGFLVADVSDKGMGAALFMAISKAVIRTRAFSGDSPAAVLRDVDGLLSDGNEEGMFVTVFYAVLNLTTGELISCNAGHDYPAILEQKDKEGSGFALMEETHGPPLAFFPGMEFPENCRQLAPGDRIFLYTDGVNEAQGHGREQFGIERMLETLNVHKEEDDQTLCEAMQDSIDEFLKDDPQFDDITMLAVSYRGRMDI